MKITDFNSKQQEILRQIAEKMEFNKSGLKVFFIPQSFEKSRHLKGFELKDIEFLREHIGYTIYMGGRNISQFSNWTKSLILHYIEIKKLVASGQDPVALRRKNQSSVYFNKVLKSLEKYTIEQLQELYLTARDEIVRKNKVIVDKKEFKDCYIYQGMKLPLCLKGKTDKEIFDYIFATRMLNEQA